MSNDTVADLLTRIRNAHRAKHKSVLVPSSNIAKNILNVLKTEGFIETYVQKTNSFGSFDGYDVVLKYYPSGEPVISLAQRVSKPGRRMYSRSDRLKKVDNGLGIAVVSTSQGVMSDREARKKKIGGEVLAYVA
jgi:small subunit ribosomal protein S8